MKPCPEIVPMTGKAALRFIAKHHRHLPKLQGALFASAVADRGEIVGVATGGNPAQVWQGTGRFVISRVAVIQGGRGCEMWELGDHAAPYCSMLLAAICRAGKALGYREAWTYTLPWEEGKSLKAAGFEDMGLTSGGEHSRASRPRAPAVHPEPKRRWRRVLGPALNDVLIGALKEAA